jgi:hypothetical protein
MVQAERKAADYVSTLSNGLHEVAGKWLQHTYFSLDKVRVNCLSKDTGVRGAGKDRRMLISERIAGPRISKTVIWEPLLFV